MANDGYPDGFPNNCEFVVVHNRDSVQEKPRVYLKTLHSIESGKELLSSYGKTYWDYHLQDVSIAVPETKKLKQEKSEKNNNEEIEKDNLESNSDSDSDSNNSSSSHLSLFVCLVCGELEEDDASLLQCQTCQNRFHFDCLEDLPSMGNAFKCKHCSNQ